ncbi:hypothetical protein B0O99DRAFT_600794 [Bisporella sp. PMI_857]|nr:hypothetical protein B0O99DRAFT_600794 [Bisporella sp. PMI_857]
MAQFSSQYNGGHDDWMQPPNGIPSPDVDIDFSDFLIDAGMMQASTGLTELPKIISLNSGSLDPSRDAFSIPRGCIALEQIQQMGINPFWDPQIEPEPPHLLSSTANPNTKDQRTSDPVVQDENTQEGELAHVRNPEASPLPIPSRKESGPSPAEWAARKNEIKYWYIEKNYTCQMMMEEMAKKRFHATKSMYKRKFKKWDWKKYGTKPSIPGPSRGPRGAPASSPGTTRDPTPTSRSSSGSTVAVPTSPRINIRIPTAMSKTNIMGLCEAMLFNAKELYLSYLSQKRWKVTNEREVEEDIHDDLLVGVATSLRNYDSLGQSGLAISFKGMRQAFQVLEKVVGIQKSADCGLFSLPAIWESFLRMIRKQKRDLAASFLSHAVQLAKQRFGKDHRFVQVLLILQKIQMEDSQQLANVIFTVYRSCIEHVENNIGSYHLTTLMLWGDFVVYLDGSSINQTRAAVNIIRRGIRKSETENGLDHAYTIDLLGLTLYMLQSDPGMAGEAEEVALDMLQRVERIKANAGGKLEEDLLITRKDLKHTLSTLRCNQKDYEKAIEYLEEFFHNKVMDDRDTLALQKLEECYTSLGKLEEAKMVQKRRMDTSQVLLWLGEVKAPEDDEMCGKNKDTVESVNGGCIQGTAVDDFKNSNKNGDQEEESEEEDDEDGDVEVEKQLLREQISELEQRLKVLNKKGKKEKKKKKKCPT